jgi:hypothetical protein
VYVIPLGVDESVYYPPAEWDEETRTGPFTFGFAGTACTRKGYDLLVKAFREEFVKEEDVRLIIRSASILSSSLPKDKRVSLIDGEISAKAMRNFYRSLDCFVLPTRGEGWGQTPVEAMACGTCAAVTNWGGCTDYFHDAMLRIAVERLVPCVWQGSQGNWALPSMVSIRYCLRWAYENRERCHEMGMEAAKHVLGHFTYRETVKAIERALSQVNTKERVECESYRVVVWHGDPARVITSVGGFIRHQPRILTSEQIAKLNPPDVGPGGFEIETRYKRAVSV